VKATILNGSNKDDPAIDDIHSVIVEELQSNGWETESLVLHEMKIAYCVGCFQCWVKTPGECRHRDDGRQVARRLIQSDLAVFLSPVTFGGYSAQLKKALDRIICLVSPFFLKINGEVHHKRRYDKYPRLLGLGVSSQEDEQSEQIFTGLVERNAINLHSPAHEGAVIVSNQEPDMIRQKIQRQLRQLGVSS
jgi:multimeric flavodoxin WrbA